MADDWLDDIVIVNDSRAEHLAGGVTVFRSAGEACGWLEHWYVESGEGFAFTATGDRLTFGVDKNQAVVVIAQHEEPSGPEIVLGWLRANAASLLETRRFKASKGKAELSRSEEHGQLPTSVEGLIAYIGFGG